MKKHIFLKEYFCLTQILSVHLHYKINNKKLKTMKLGEFIKNFSHNNVIRLLYKIKGGHELVLNDWNDVSMDHELNNGKGIFRHYIGNEVIGLATISFGAGQGIHHSEALNIVIERLDDQPFIEEKISDNSFGHNECNG